MMVRTGGEVAFGTWIRQVFDHAVEGPLWYADADADDESPLPDLAVQHLTRFLQDPLSALAPYTEAQIGQGLWYLLCVSSHHYVLPLTDPGVPWPARRECIRAVPHLFARLFAPRCDDALSHFDEGGDNALNVVCYMWWDLLDTYRHGSDPHSLERDRECLDAMERILNGDSTACRESALHGLGHWQTDHAESVAAIIDRFLERHSNLRPELRRYAEAARSGCVL